MTLRLLIVDDEPVARRRLRRLVRDIADVEIAGEAGDGRSAVSAIRTLTPDVVLLDVQMPEMDGFGVLQAVGDRLPAVIFVTAFDRYALRAFEVHALDFLLKPVTAEKLAQALERARTRIAERRGALLDPRLLAFLDDLAGGRRRFLSRLPVKVRGKMIVVDLADVDWIKAADNYVTLHVGGTSHPARETMSRLERELDPNQFVRIHRSVIVQVDRIKELLPDFHGDFVVVLRDGTRVTLSRTYRSKVEGILGREL